MSRIDGLFSEERASAADQLDGTAFTLAESADTYEGWIAVGDRLSRRMQYREAVLAYTQAVRLAPDRYEALRKRGGKYLATLQTGPALADLKTCLQMGGDEADLRYRIGLCRFYAGDFAQALSEFSQCFSVCSEELGIGAIYWSMIAAWRLGQEAELLREYRDDMAVGHHTAYAFSVRTALGRIPPAEALRVIGAEKDDLQFSMMAYGAAAFCGQLGDNERAASLYRKILERDSFWVSFAFLAAWNDRRQGRIR